ncbi:MAG: NAD(P)H-dependent oxidoreductase [Gammaproteobacteria bacterium]|nr:NAD(P)H-dependent oxidoreductase [Gammaproteobacteria bacterium]
MKDTIAIFASARRNGNTGKFIDWIGNELDIDIIDLSEKNISPYDYEHNNLNDDFIPLINQLLGYEQIIFVTPIYWYSSSAQMKIFMDRIADLLYLEELKDKGRKLRDKTGYVVCTSTSDVANQSFLNIFKDTFEYLGMNYGGYVHANCANGYSPNEYREDVSKFVELVKCSDLSAGG